MSTPETPQNPQAEEHVLGAMMMNERVIADCSEMIGPLGDAFYRESHRVIYRAILSLHGDAKPVDAIAVADFLERFDKLAGVGGRGRIAELLALTTSTTNAKHYAGVVVEQARLRELDLYAQRVRQIIHGEREGRTADELIDEAELALSDVRDRYSGSDAQERTAYELAEYLDEKLHNPQPLDDGVLTPFGLPRMQPGRLYVLAGYQADGKTAISAEFIQAAVSGSTSVGFASYEMGWEDVAVRLAANLGAPAKQVETGWINAVDKERIVAAISRLAMMNVRVRYETRPTVSSLRRWQRRHRFGLLVVDHLHQFPIEDFRYERQLLERIIRELTVLAIAERVPVLLLAQLSRTGDPKKPYPRPSMASLRGTAMIESLAWCVWFVWRERDDKNLATSKAEFITAKNRSGPTGVFELHFEPRLVRFTRITAGDA